MKKCLFKKNLLIFLFCSFIIEDFKVSRQYMVNFNLSVCFETYYPCAIHVPVLRNTQLPKRICNWKNDFIDTGNCFSTDDGKICKLIY